ncbi:hypothetical protein MRX96_016344 [Rhipicephalus microplus]
MHRPVYLALQPGRQTLTLGCVRLPQLGACQLVLMPRHPWQGEREDGYRRVVASHTTETSGYVHTARAVTRRHVAGVRKKVAYTRRGRQRSTELAPSHRP